MLYKAREFVNSRVLELIFYAIFDCHLNYAIQYGIKTKIQKIADSYYRRKPSELLVLNVEIFF